MAKESSAKKNKDYDDKVLRQLTAAELKDKLVACSKDQFKLRMQKGAGQPVKPHLIKQVRRYIAKIKTVLTEKASD